MQSLVCLTACLHLLVLLAEQALSQSVPRPHLSLRANLPRQTTPITTTVTTAVQPTATATVTVTSTAGTTLTPTSLATPIPPTTGPTASPLGFIIGITIGVIAISTMLGLLIYSCCSKRGLSGLWARTGNAPPHELQTTTTGTAAEIQPTANQEVYGYYAPPTATNANDPAATATQEVYGYYAPTVAPRMGDVVPVRPAM